MQIPLSATLTSQHKAHPAGAFSRETRQLLCPVGHLLYKRRLFAWQTLYKNKNHAQNKHPECQHCTHRKRQTKAFASQRRTARNERIPPDGFRELCLGQYIPPALPGISSKRGDFCSKRPECQHCTYRKGQTKAFASPRRTARNERFRRTG